VSKSLKSLFVSLAALYLALGSIEAASAAERCAGLLNEDLCYGANPNCPTLTGAGPADSSWPMFQRDAQHTGKSSLQGPACGEDLWVGKLSGKILSQMATGPANGAGLGTLFVAAGKYPVCAMDPVDGTILWCDTTDTGKLPDYSSPAVSADDIVYIGTRDNDLWAIEIPQSSGAVPAVDWRKKVCSDGDVTTQPTIRKDGVVYMGSDSLGAGSLFAMCPGSAEQVKWCRNPLGGGMTSQGLMGGGLKNVSPTLNADESRVYVTMNGAFVASYDASTGADRWRLQLDSQRNNMRGSNYTPVYNSSNGRIYVGFDDGIWEITEGTDPSSGAPVATQKLLFDTRPDNRSLFAPPALDAATGTLYFGATRGRNSTFYAIGTDGRLKWKKAVVNGRFRNLPPVVDASGHVYVAISNRLYAFEGANGHEVWTRDFESPIWAAPIIDDGRLYLGTIVGNVHAVGCAP
jgi:outer membrane protein assembly factor BamB